MLKPVVTACAAAVELDSAPFPQEWVLDGRPQARAKEIARSRDGAMTVIAWSCTKGRFRWQYLVDEMAHILSGEVVIVDHTDTERRLGPGDTAFFPAGSSSVWHVKDDVPKSRCAASRCPSRWRLGCASGTDSDAWREAGRNPMHKHR